MKKTKPNLIHQIESYFNEYNVILNPFLSKNNYLENDGLHCYLGEYHKKEFYFVCMNPLVRGGTFSIENLKYLHEFLDFIETDNQKKPFLFLINSAGVRLTQSRTMFNSIWGLLPRFFQLKKQRLFISIAHQVCLGAGALFFGQAHIRMASTPETLINLTGPGVISQFFGSSTNFNQYASALHQHERHLLVQEINYDLNYSLERFLQIMSFNFSLDIQFKSIPLKLKKEFFGDSLDLSFYNEQKFAHFLKQIADEAIEILSDTAGAGLTFLCRKKNKRFGLLINPIDHPVNTISVFTVDRYKEALQIFKRLELPLIAITDTPGGDPRQKNSDSNIITKTLELIEQLCDYPFPKIGLIAGRCFGGSGLLSLPVVHGSYGLYALENAKIGAMADEVIEKIALQNLKYIEEWKLSKFSHKKDLSDLLQSHNLKGIIKTEEIGQWVDSFLNKDMSFYEK